MQTTMRDDPTRAFPGLVADSSQVRDIISRIVSTQQLSRVTITGNTDGTYEVTIDGDVEASFAASSNTVQEIRDDLLADLQASTKHISATAVSTNAIDIESTDEDDSDGFTIAVSGPGGPDITVATLVTQQQKIRFGVAVCSDDEAAESGTQCRLPRQSADVTANLLGISIADTSYPNDDGTGYADKSSVPIFHRGRIWVRTEDACSENGDVYVRFTDPSTDYGLGSFRSDADGGDAAQAPNAKYRLASAAGGLNIVELL